MSHVQQGDAGRDPVPPSAHFFSLSGHVVSPETTDIEAPRCDGLGSGIMWDIPRLSHESLCPLAVRQLRQRAALLSFAKAIYGKQK